MGLSIPSCKLGKTLKWEKFGNLAYSYKEVKKIVVDSPLTFVCHKVWHCNDVRICTKWYKENLLLVNEICTYIKLL